MPAALSPGSRGPDKKLVLQCDSGNRSRRMAAEILVPAL